MKKPGANAMAAIACAAGVMFMTGAAFAAVPLYQLFCQVTGFDGTVRKADKAPDVQLDQTVLIRFDTNVRGLPMTFRAEQVTQRVRIGETGMAFFDVTNTSDKPISAKAAYNVVPERAGPYFQKLQCFCFDEQIIQPGQTILVFGCGPVGLAVICMLKAHGVRTVIASDYSSGRRARMRSISCQNWRREASSRRCGAMP